MVFAAFSLKENYWEEFELHQEDIEFIYNHLLEIETPLTPQELISVLVEERIQKEIKAVEQQRLDGGEIYAPKEKYDLEKQLVFPALNWRQGKVISKRPGWNPDYGDFEVIRVRFDDGDEKEFAAGFENHSLNEPPDVEGENIPTAETVLATHGK